MWCTDLQATWGVWDEPGGEPQGGPSRRPTRPLGEARRQTDAGALETQRRVRGVRLSREPEAWLRGPSASRGGAHGDWRDASRRWAGLSGRRLAGRADGRAGRAEIGGMRRGAVSVLPSGVNVGAGPGWGLPGAAGVFGVLRAAA